MRIEELRRTSIEPITPNNYHGLYAAVIFLVVSTLAGLPSYGAHSHGSVPFTALLEISVLIGVVGIF